MGSFPLDVGWLEGSFTHCISSLTWPRKIFFRSPRYLPHFSLHSKFNPQHISYMLAVKFIVHLNVKQNSLILKGCTVDYRHICSSFKCKRAISNRIFDILLTIGPHPRPAQSFFTGKEETQNHKRKILTTEVPLCQTFSLPEVAFLALRQEL